MLVSDTSVGVLIFLLNAIFYALLCFFYKKKLSVLRFDCDDKSLWLNDEKVLTFRTGSRNSKFIELLYQNADKEVEIERIEQEVFFNSKVILSKVVRNTGIPSEILKSHFLITKKGITLKKEGSTI